MTIISISLRSRQQTLTELTPKLIDSSFSPLGTPLCYRSCARILPSGGNERSKIADLHFTSELSLSEM